MAAQAVLDAVLTRPLEPLAHSTRRHPEGSGDVLLFPALLFQLPGAPPPSLAPVGLNGFAAHPASVPSVLHSMRTSVSTKWRQQYADYADQAFAGKGHRYTDEAKVAELERLIGQLTVENAI